MKNMFNNWGDRGLGKNLVNKLLKKIIRLFLHIIKLQNQF